MESEEQQDGFLIRQFSSSAVRLLPCAFWSAAKSRGYALGVQSAYHTRCHFCRQPMSRPFSAAQG